MEKLFFSILISSIYNFYPSVFIFTVTVCIYP
jgi:hypothetical protein